MSDTPSNILMAIQRYLEATGGAVFYTEGLGFGHYYTIELNESGIFSSELRHAPTGTLVVMALQVVQEGSGSNKDRVVAAWNTASPACAY